MTLFSIVKILLTIVICEIKKGALGHNSYSRPCLTMQQTILTTRSIHLMILWHMKHKLQCHRVFKSEIEIVFMSVFALVESKP